MWDDILTLIGWSIAGITSRLAMVLFRHIYPKITIKKPKDVRQTNKKAA